MGLKEQRIRTFFRDSTIKYKLIKNPLIHGALQEYILSYKDECEHSRATKHRCTHKYEQNAMLMIIIHGPNPLGLKICQAERLKT